jgi:hypothetical protein
MATTTLTIANELLSTTHYILNDQWVDNRHRHSAFMSSLEKVHGRGAPTEDGGSRYVQPLGFYEHSSATRMQSGYELLNMTVTDVHVPAVFTPAHVLQPIIISRDEEIKNKGDSAVLKILEDRQKQVMNAMYRNWCKRILTGESIAGYEDWTTLNGIFDTTSGILEEQAIGSQDSSVGGVSKATYSGIPGWQNQRVNLSSSFNANGLAGLDHLRVRTAAQAPGGSDDMFIFMSLQGYENLKRSLRTYERYVVEKSTDGADGGKLMSYWDGIPLEMESHMPTDTTVHTSGVITAYFLDLGSIHPVWDSEGFFAAEPFETVSGQSDTRASKVRLYGQMCAKHLASSGIAYDGETF